MAVKLLWTGIWMAYMGAPVSDLVSGDRTTTADVLGWIGLVGFVATYLALVMRNIARSNPALRVLGPLVGLAVLAVVLPTAFGSAWLVLFVYVAVACGAVLPGKLALWAVVGSTAVLVTVGVLGSPESRDFVPALMIPALLGGFAMVGVRHMVRTTTALREARATVAHLAANEERLRMARDLHDLLGHSLSLITLKSELAGRMLPDRPDKAAKEVADINTVGRQALADVRAAVTGYRRPTLTGELAGARTALAAAGVVASLPAEDASAPGTDAPAPETEAALAWALREAVTNVVRHSGASRCAVSLVERQTLDGLRFELTVEDDGKGGPAAFGNGLTGIAERLAAVDGTLDVRPGPRGGFALVARVPVVSPA
ncbi:sensor histidine kinase [Yinghuangia aomiensis]